MRITSKGQVTIPQEIREKLGFLPHTEVTFEIDGSTVRIRKVGKRKAGRGRRLVELMQGRASVRMSTDEIMALTRGRR
jgi:AbrB family looped-hinge helix DNA binding protein